MVDDTVSNWEFDPRTGTLSPTYRSAAKYCKTEEDAAVTTILECVFGIRFSFSYHSTLEWIDADRACTVFFYTSDGRIVLLKSDPMPYLMHVVEGESEDDCMSTLVHCLKTGTYQPTNWELCEGIDCEKIQVPAFSSAVELRMKLELGGHSISESMLGLK